MKKIVTLFLFFLSSSFFAQVIGKVTDINNQPLPYVSIYLENLLTGTTTNNNGLYELDLKTTGKHTVVFQFLGFKTLKKRVEIKSFPFTLNIHLTPEEVILSEVLITTKENPANQIIRNVIANKVKNTEKQKNYTANFYSRGLFKIKNAPKKIFGQEVGDLGGGLDSTRTGIFYLSETISKIKYQKNPKKFKEKIIASKVSGQDNGISFNQARDVNFNLYNNQISIADSEIFSPIANYAFNHYNYKLEGTFYNSGKLINKIKLLPKRENDKVFSGEIYIVEEDWQIYGANLRVTGAQIGNPIIDQLYIKQNYNFDTVTQSWVLILQTIDFKAGIIGLNMNGRFSASYSNYNFNPNFTKKSFDDTILSFAKQATKKDSSYWNTLRPVPLTAEEKKDYTFKDSIKNIRKSKKYLDSVDLARNKFKILSPITGYTYRNSYNKWRFNFDGLLNTISYNTVQGFSASIPINYSKRKNDLGNRWSIGTNLNYGFADKRFRPTFYFYKKWNNIERPNLRFSLGNNVVQFDYRNPISTLNNSIYTLFFKRNYAKFYDKTFVNLSFSQEIARGVNLFSSLEYANRKPLLNTTDYSFFKRGRAFFTNNPIDRNSANTSFNEHTMFTANLAATFRFGSKYMEYPKFRFSVTENIYPTLSVGYRKNFGSNLSNLHSDFIWSRLQQNASLGNVGKLQYNARAGVFLKQKNIAFLDYYHPLGNEIDIAPKNRLSSFYLMPYYQFSTNNKYAELHVEHNFNGFILSKIPFLNKLNFYLVGSAKAYFSSDRKPYTEYAIGLDNIGWGKWRFLRVDYVHSNFGGVANHGFLFGINLFN